MGNGTQIEDNNFDFNKPKKFKTKEKLEIIISAVCRKKSEGEPK